jgi:hypothetical protein
MGIAFKALLLEQGVDVPMAKIVAVPTPSPVAYEDEGSGVRSRRALSQSHGIAGPHVKTTGSAAGQDDIHLRALMALGGFEELEEECATLGWQTAGLSSVGGDAVYVAPA